jgi:hypothetical protein
MGYACPVCETPHPDGEHLANHLAFTALLGREDHEAWLAEHAPDWESMDPGELAATVTDGVPETEFPQVFDDTTDGHDHDHEHGQSFDPADQGAAPANAFASQRDARGRGDLDEEAAEVVEEARRMTEQMLDDERDDGAADTAEGDTDGDADDDGDAGEGAGG